HQMLRQRDTLRHEYRLRHADGSYRWIDDSLVQLRDAAGRPQALIGAWIDVTERHEADSRARLIAQVFESSEQAIFITDAQTRFISINAAFTRITGYTLDEVRGRTPALLKSGRQDRAFYAAMWARIHAEDRWEGEIWNRRRNGEVFPEWLTINAVRDARGELSQYLGLFTETSSRKAAEARIEHLAHYDALTGLPNRTLLADRAGVAFSAASREQRPVLVLHLNVDHFSAINESLGHAAGDQVLRELTARLQAVIAPDDTLCRLGGDNFILLLPGAAQAQLAPLSLRLMDAAAEALPIAGRTLHLTLSIGVAVYPDNGTDLATLTQAAESAVHLAKREGRNTVRLFSPRLQLQVEETLTLTSELRRALERRQLLLHYQPQVDARSGCLIGVEALLRWQHPQRGLVPPGQFIPLAEEAGLIGEIGTWVLHEALRQTAAWQAEGLPIVPVAVNLSVRQFRDPALCVQIEQALQQSGLPAHLLELELTESVALQDSEQATSTIAALKQLGVTLSIDDFGTGYSSLSYLKRFALDRLKIDQSFVRGLNHDPKDEAIVATIITLAHSLGLRTLAEGVETAAQAEMLRRSGCDELQGYLHGRPMPPEQLAERLAQPEPSR
ncbi:MAG: hypothetical protein RJA44_204, partial [Pseudomonadota bacterium]